MSFVMFASDKQVTTQGCAHCEQETQHLSVIMCHTNQQQLIHLFSDQHAENSQTSLTGVNVKLHTDSLFCLLRLPG